MKSRLIEVWVTVEDKAEADEIAHDIQEILNKFDITNRVKVTDETD